MSYANPQLQKTVSHLPDSLQVKWMEDFVIFHVNSGYSIASQYSTFVQHIVYVIICLCEIIVSREIIRKKYILEAKICASF